MIPAGGRIERSTRVRIRAAWLWTTSASAICAYRRKQRDVLPKPLGVQI